MSYPTSSHPESIDIPSQLVSPLAAPHVLRNSHCYRTMCELRDSAWHFDIQTQVASHPSRSRTTSLEGILCLFVCRRPCRAPCLLSAAQNAISVFHISHTLPALLRVSVSGGNVGLPGCHPEGMSSPVDWWCWKAFNCRITSATFRPTGGVSISIACSTPSGSIRKRPRTSTPFSSSYTPYTVPILPPGSEIIGYGTPPFTILDSSTSCQTLWEKLLSTLIARTSTPNSRNSGYLTATAVNSVGHTQVKSAG